MQDTIDIVNSLFELYRLYGNSDYIGEPVSQIEHMSQSAQLAIDEGYDDEVILAAFFHDLGHICVSAGETDRMGAYGNLSHERIGARYLRSKGFPERVARLVENHVQAKRYLTFRHPDYYLQLSEASRKTLEFQGGIMTEVEALRFEADELFQVSIRMRRWDEMAKEENTPIIDLDLLKEKAISVLSRAKSG